MTVRRWLAASVMVALMLGRPATSSAREVTQGEEAGYALAAVGLNLVYVPAKALVALGGGIVGSVVGLLTGGDTRSAYAIWVPTASGTYMLNAANVDGSEPIQFWGTDYADEPSPAAAREGEGGEVYESMYRQ